MLGFSPLASRPLAGALNTAGGATSTGFLQRFYWNNQLLTQTNPMLRFGALLGIQPTPPTPTKAGNWLVLARRRLRR